MERQMVVPIRGRARSRKLLQLPVHNLALSPASSTDSIAIPFINPCTNETNSTVITTAPIPPLFSSATQRSASSEPELPSSSTMATPVKSLIAPEDEVKADLPQVPEAGVDPEDTPINVESHQGENGEPIKLKANFCRVRVLPFYGPCQYSVSFSNQVDRISMRKKLFAVAVRRFDFAYVFDGIYLFTAKPLEELDVPMAFEATWKEFSPIVISLKEMAKVQPGSPLYSHVYSTVMQSFLRKLDMLPMGRNLFDPRVPIKITKRKLELWPGYITSLRAHEGEDLFLSIELTHKVIHMDSLLETIHSIQGEHCKRSPDDVKKGVSSNLKDAIVITTYNKKTYLVDDIDFENSPTSHFNYKGNKVSFMDYYKDHYNITIKDKAQPLVISKLKKKDDRGKETETVIVLIPELCQLTGLTKSMRRDFMLMRDLSYQIQVTPETRMDAIRLLLNRLKNHEEIMKGFGKWGLQLDNAFIDVPGRTLVQQNVVFTNGAPLAEVHGFSAALRQEKLLSTVNLRKWVILFPQQIGVDVDRLITLITKTANQMNMSINLPLQRMGLQDTKKVTYLKALDALLRRHKGLQMVFIILHNTNPEIYATVKKRLTVEAGIPSQCILAHKIASKDFLPFAPKLVAQMNCKLGGEPWSVKLPLKNTMFIGFDIYKLPGRGQRGGFGAVVATYSEKFTRYFSTTFMYTEPVEICNNLRYKVKECLAAYQEENHGALPDMIFMYRGGAEEDQLKRIETVELENIQRQLTICYKKSGRQPSLTYIIVSPRMNVRLFNVKPSRCDNPPPGTVLDSLVTLPERYDFYLVSCGVRRGTVSPSYYNVIHDESKLSVDKIQLVTYKLCHIYYNWTGSIGIPAPCQYARKLASQTAIAYSGRANRMLSKLLHFL